jgi:hypothetical protein
MSEGVIRVSALASPVIWFASHATQFALAPLACAWHSNSILWMAAGVAMFLDLCSGWAAWSAWQRQPAAGMTDKAPMPLWLAMSGIILSASFFLVIVAQTIPSLMLEGCA